MRQNGLSKVVACVLTMALMMQWGQMGTIAAYSTEETWHFDESFMGEETYEIEDGDSLKSVDLSIIGALDDRPFDDAIVSGEFHYLDGSGVITNNVAAIPTPDFQIIAHSAEDDPFALKSIDLKMPEENKEIVIKGFYKDQEVASYTTTIEQGTSTVDVSEEEGFDYINEFRIYKVFDGVLVVVAFDNITVDQPSNAYEPKISDINISEPNGTYGIGEEIAIDVVFDKSVVVEGEGDILLYLGSDEWHPIASYQEQTSDTTLEFIYIVGENQEIEELEYANTYALETIDMDIYSDDLHIIPADLTLPAPGEEGSLSAKYDIVIDGVRPEVTLTPDVSTIESLDSFDVTVSLSEACAFGTDNYPVIYNGSVTSAEQIDGSTFRLEVTPIEAGNVTLTYPSDRIIDQADNGNIGVEDKLIQWTSGDNSAPVITSIKSDEVSENADYSFYTATATDADEDLLTWSLLGKDADLFSLNAESGMLTFVESPDYENPQDDNKDNIYELILSVTDGELISQMPLEIQVYNRSEYVITSSGDPISVEEGTSEIFYTATGYSVEGEELDWYLDGMDADVFTIDKTGALRFTETPRLNEPKDFDKDNVYNFGVGIGSAYLPLQVTVVEEKKDTTPTPDPTPDPTPSRPSRSDKDDKDNKDDAKKTELDQSIQESGTIADRINEGTTQEKSKKITTVNGDNVTKADLTKAVKAMVEPLSPSQEDEPIKVTPVLNIALDKSTGVEIDKDNLNQLVEHDVELSIQHGDTLLTIQPSELKGDNNEELKDIESLEISVEKLEEKDVDTVSKHYRTQGVDVVGNPYVFHMTATTKEGKQEVGSLGNYMTKMLPAYEEGTAVVVGFADGKNTILDQEGEQHKNLVNQMKTNMIVAVPYKTLEINEKDTVAQENYYQAQNKSFSTYYIVHNNAQFADMKDHWAAEAATNMVNRYIMADYNAINFKASEGVTRREMARIIVSGLGLSFYNFEDSFKDVDADDSYLIFMNAVVDEKLMSATEGNFRPDDVMTRGDMVQLIAKMMDYVGQSESLTEADKDTFTDLYRSLSTLDTQEQENVMLSIKSGIIKGRSNNNLALDEKLTRAEAAVIYERLLKKIGFID